LDLTIFKGQRWKSNQKLDIKSYQKPENKGLYLPYSTFYTFSCKKAVITGELQRLTRNSSSYENFLDSRNIFFKHLLNRGYPLNFIKECNNRINYEKRSEYLMKKGKKDKNFIIFSAHYEPTAISYKIKETIEANWSTLGVFGKTFKPIVAWKKSNSLKDMLVRAKL